MRPGSDDVRRSIRIRVHVVHHPLGRWEVLPPNGRSRIPCETLEDARRVAHLAIGDGDDGELIVRDAYHRVLEHGLIHGDRPQAANPAPAPTRAHPRRPRNG